jgi:hypothetical protein
VRRVLGAITVSLLALTVTAGAFAMDPPTVAPATPAPACKSMPVTSTLRALLRTAHHHVFTRNFEGPPQKSTYYGRCGLTYYAVASFLSPPLGYTDQPEVFKRKPGHSWKDQGDTGGDLCGSKKVPASLLKLWKVRCP